MAFDIFALPFSYNGPCASLSGAGTLFNAIRATSHGGHNALLNQSFCESLAEYLARAEKIINLSKRCMIFGGNHLSCLPAHKIAISRGMYRFALDAHRDYATPVYWIRRTQIFLILREVCVT